MFSISANALCSLLTNVWKSTLTTAVRTMSKNTVLEFWIKSNVFLILKPYNNTGDHLKK